MEDSYMKKTETAAASSGKEKLITLENVSKHFHVVPARHWWPSTMFLSISIRGKPWVL